MHIVNHFHHTKYILLINDNSRQTENAPSRVIGVNCHFYIVLIAYRHYSFKKILQIFKKLFIVNILIHFKKLFYFFHSLRFPTRHNSAVHILWNRFKHLLGNDFINIILIVCKHGWTVRTFSCKLTSCPVEYWHKVIAHKMNVLFSEIFKRFNIIVYVLISVRCSDFNCVMNIYAFNSAYMKSAFFDFIFHFFNSFSAPYFTRCGIVKCCYNARNARYLSYLL